MQITVFGANGRVGKLVVAQAIELGLTVIATAHHNSSLPNHPNLRVVQCDIYNKDDVTTAIIGSDAVISALSSWGTAKKDILSTAMQSIVTAMDAQGVRRIVSLTGSDARAAGDSKSLLHNLSHTMISLIAGKILSDGEQHIELLEKSALDWTVVRSPIMNEHGAAQKYTLSNKRPPPWGTINRHSVALSLVGLLTDTKYLKQAPFIVRT